MTESETPTIISSEVDFLGQEREMNGKKRVIGRGE